MHEFLNFAYDFFVFPNSYANSQVNFVHEIRNFDKLGKFHTNSREFVNVMLRMACTVPLFGIFCFYC